MKIELRTQRLDIISAAQAEDVAVRIQYASKHASIANAWKKWQGEVLGLRRLKTVESKKAYEKEFAAWAADKPEYKTLLQDMSASYEKAKKAYYVRELFTESLGGIEALTLANTMLAIKNRAKSAEDLQLNIKKNQGAFLKNYNASIDRKIAHAMLAEFLKRMPQEKIPADLTAAIEAKGGATAYVDYLYDNTKIISADFDPATLDSDPMVELATILLPMRREISQVAYRNLSNIPDVEQWYRPYMRALREWDKERAFYPDANFTLRVAYGSVAGYEYADGEYHNPVTSIDGIIAKDDPNIYDYNIPQSLRDIYARKDYGRWASKIGDRESVAVCFLATNHTSGGNSGSPVINGKGELIGINFDRTWRSTMSDMEFDPTICRNISVDIRYVLFVVDRIGGASYLLDEMDLK